MEQLFAQEKRIFEETRGCGRLSYMVIEETDASYFRFAGMVLGKALFDKVPVDAPLNRLLFNAIVDTENTLEDIRHYDSAVSRVT